MLSMHTADYDEMKHKTISLKRKNILQITNKKAHTEIDIRDSPKQLVPLPCTRPSDQMGSWVRTLTS